LAYCIAERSQPCDIVFHLFSYRPCFLDRGRRYPAKDRTAASVSSIGLQRCGADMLAATYGRPTHSTLSMRIKPIASGSEFTPGMLPLP
jgi:hypothetical protein